MFRRALVAGATAVMVLLGPVVVAQAAPPRPAPSAEQLQAQCIAKETVAALKAIDRQTWKSRAAREAAVRAIPAKVRAACPRPAPQPPPPVDQCANIAGVQATVPAGMVRDANGNCAAPPPPPVDQCANIAGVQATVPAGMVRDANGNCATPPPPPVDQCANIAGVQATVPAGMVRDERGNCGTPPSPGYSHDGQDRYSPPRQTSTIPGGGADRFEFVCDPDDVLFLFSVVSADPMDGYDADPAVFGSDTGGPANTGSWTLRNRSQTDPVTVELEAQCQQG